MKLLMFSRLFWPHGGGVEKHVEMLSLELMKRGYEITVLTEQHDLDLPLEETYRGIKIVRIPYFASGSKRLVWTWVSDHEKLINSADIIHIHDVFWWYWPMRIVQLFKPIYITFHGYEGKNPPTWKAVAHRKLAEIFSNGAICVGDFMRKWYKASPEIVTYGAGNNLTTRVSKTRMNSKSAVFWGRFDDDTGITVYIDALKNLENWKLCIYGDGPLKSQISEQIKNNKNISLNKWSKNIPNILNKGKYAFVSRYLSIIEAMQANKLVVAVYDNQIKKDYLTCHPMSANMIIVGNADEVVVKLKSLSKAKLKQMTDKSYKWAKNQTWGKMADNYEALWSK